MYFTPLGACPLGKWRETDDDFVVQEKDELADRGDRSKGRDLRSMAQGEARSLAVTVRSGPFEPSAELIPFVERSSSVFSFTPDPGSPTLPGMSVEPLKHFAIILPAVADMMDEQHLSTDECMTALRQFLGEAEQPVEVREAIARLEDIEDEGEFRYMLGQESLRAVGRKG